MSSEAWINFQPAELRSGTSPSDPGRKRVRNACARCRRQKLKCDRTRPCPLCVHARTECREVAGRERTTGRSDRLRRNIDGDGPVTVSQPTAANKPSPFGATRARASTTGHSPLPANGTPEPRETRSALHVARQIFKSYRYPNPHIHSVDAIPDAVPAEEDPSAGRQGLMPVSDIIGVSFPPQDVSRALLRSYIDSMHWYLTVFDESSLRSRLEPIFCTGLAEAHQKPLLMLALVVLIIGIRFRDHEKNWSRSAIELERMGETLVEAAQKGYLFAMDMPTVESVAFSFLLSCHYLFSQQPNLSAIAMDAAVNAAQTIGLHQESTWGPVGFVERQIRRRVWWTVFTGATYVALTHGRPSRVTAESCDVQAPDDLEGDAVPPSEFASLEHRHDGRTQPLSLSSYVRYRNQIYIIAASISRHVDASRSQPAELVAENTRGLHRRLLEWEKTVPPELRLETYANTEGAIDADRPHRRMFAMQAMALQMAYDNIQLALARPFVPEKREPRERRGRVDPSSMGDVSPLLQQCFTSAMRTSLIGSSSTVHILRCMRNSPINIHLGVHAFAAGVVLGSLALRNPVLPEGQDCKRGIARIIQAPRAAGLTAQVWVQASAVLTDLMHVVANEEVATLLAEQNDDGGGGGGGVDTQQLTVTAFGKPPEWYADAGQGDPVILPGGTQADIREVATQTPTGDVPSGQAGMREVARAEDHPCPDSGKQQSLPEGPATVEVDAEHDLSPFSEFVTENYTLLNYGQAWMLGDLSQFSI